MNVKLLLQNFDLWLQTEPGSFPRIEITMTAVVTSSDVAFDVVGMSAFKSKVQAFVESELPKHVAYVLNSPTAGRAGSAETAEAKDAAVRPEVKR